MIDKYSEVFFKKENPTLLTRFSFMHSYCFPWEHEDGYTEETFTPAFLRSLDACILVTSLQLNASSQEIDALKLVENAVKNEQER